jgi:Ig-like domain-containing protein
MLDLKKTKTFVAFTLLILVLITSACGSSAQDENRISTAVAQTVQAQNSLTKVATMAVISDTETPEANMETTTTQLPASAFTQIANTKPSGPVEFCTASADFVGETIPDGTIVQPGATFTKVWNIQNTGTCPWNSKWQLIFQGGDIMGGAATYNLPQPASSGQTVEVPIVLTAPQQGGTYIGKWMLKSPWGMTFGVGQSSVPLSVSIVVGSLTPEKVSTSTVFGVTGVKYDVAVRCTDANTFYTITASITTNGPVNVSFTWNQSDGNEALNNKVNFPEATTKSLTHEWIQGNGTNPTQRWVQVIIDEPTYQEYDKVVLPKLCP